MDRFPYPPDMGISDGPSYPIVPAVLLLVFALGLWKFGEIIYWGWRWLVG